MTIIRHGHVMPTIPEQFAVEQRVNFRGLRMRSQSLTGGSFFNDMRKARRLANEQQERSEILPYQSNSVLRGAVRVSEDRREDMAPGNRSQANSVASHADSLVFSGWKQFVDMF